MCSNEFRKKLNCNTLIFYTGTARSASKILAEQTKVSSNKDKRIILRRMAQLAYDFKKGIESKNFNALGEMLKENWKLKKSLTSDISNTLIDDMYESAINSGAIGGKLLGAGAGGFMMFLAPKKLKKKS